MDQEKLTQGDIGILNNWAGFLSIKPNFGIKSLLDCDENIDIIFLETGNQFGKNTNITLQYIIRFMGKHPIEKRNMRPNTPIRTLRVGAETLPNEKAPDGEVRNTVYPTFKRLLPSSCIKQDITIRKPVLIIRDIWQGGADIIIEFVSYGQETQTQAGQQRWSVYLDEQSPKSFYEEQIPRLLAASQSGSGGDLIIGLTPADLMSWTYEDIYQWAGVIYNSPCIIKYMKEKTGISLKAKEIINNQKNIAVIRAATDDNPTLTSDVIERQFSVYDDESTMEVRRYGIFHQISGVVLKEFDSSIHRISRERYFPEGIPYKWVHARGIDFHEHTNWACGWVALSQDNEAFVYEEFNPSPDRMVTIQIAREIAHRSKDYKYPLNLVDPRAAIKQANSGLTPLDDLNRAFHEYKMEGIGTGGFWQTWDTKSLKGRDVVKERLKNSRLVGRPFNNRIVTNGRETHLPTLWILDNCVQTLNSFKNWRWEQWATKESRLTKEDKNKAEDRYSHFPIMIECIFKNSAFSIGRFKERFLPDREPAYRNAFMGRT